MKALKLFTLLSLSCSSLVVANSQYNSLENYISENKQQQFSYDYKKNITNSSILRDSWIAPVNLNYNYTKSNPNSHIQKNQSATLQLNQPIFQSGGIYFGIKYAEALKKYSDFNTDIAKKKVIKETISLLMQIKKTDLNIERQKLQILNAKINLSQKKEQYLSGQLDSGFLDKAIIELNSVTQRLYDIETSKEKLISNFKTLSDLDYKKLEIPHLKLLNKKQFLQNNLSLKMEDAKIETHRYSKNITIAKYLPRINFVAGYTWSKSEDTSMQLSIPTLANPDELDYYNYGIKISIPLNINTFVDIEHSKVDFLKSSLQKEERLIQVSAVFEQVMQNIQNLQKKQKLSLVFAY